MIEVHLRQRRDNDYHVAATIAVTDAGTVTVTGDESIVSGLQQIPVIDRAHGGPIRFADDPAGWARNLPTLLRTPYLMAQIVADTTAPAAPTRRPRRQPAHPINRHHNTQLTGPAAAGHALANARKQAGLSQAALAAHLDVSPVYVSRLETGHLNVTLDQLTKVAAAIPADLDIQIHPRTPQP